ncbi:response regulator transcription factor [Mastigocladopsis repens]|uniref:response regulator transcription factor n=1 Tax=Mastigocladopsis repens TaxID=221287 RepID=UPI0002FAAE69|nr:response regulator transcription factor [Mastigocladopsis repens]
MIRLLLVDDQIIIRQGLKNLLESKSDLQVVGDAENGQLAIEAVEALYGTPLQPDVVLMDVRMPIMDGVAATRLLCQRFPEIQVLVLTTFDDDEYVSQAMRHGAKGYLLKHTPLEELAIAIRSVHQGYTHMGPGLFEKALTTPHISNPIHSAIPSELAELSPREKEVLRLIAMGLSNREIAHTLYISERTVRNHVTSILGQLQLRDRTQAALLASTFLSYLEI